MRKSNIHEAHRCDKHTHYREENLQHFRQMLHESASDAFAMQSNPSNCSWCNIQKLEFYIHCCSTCHAFPRSHVNLDIAPHTLFYMHWDVRVLADAAPDDSPDTIHAHQHTFVLLQQCSKLLEPICQGVCHQRDSGEEHAVLITSVALRESASALAPSSPMLLE